jgi:Protein of unknown function (DUF4238)
MPANNPPEDHHFLPVFYLSRWQRECGFVEFARRGNGIIEGRPCYPKGTGYQRRLYSNQFQSDAAKAQALETEFMQSLDRRAAEALALLETGKSSWTDEEGSNWTRFILSLLQRVPEEVEKFKDSYLGVFQNITSQDEARYKAVRWDGLPETLVGFLAQRRELAERSSLNTLRTLIDHPGLI